MVVERAKRDERRRLGAGSVVAIVFAFAALLVVGFIVSVPLTNDAAARQVESELLGLPLPPGAQRVDSLAQAAKIVGNGNGMQYIGALLIRSDQSVDELRDFYDAQNSQLHTSATVISTTDAATDEFHGADGFLSEKGEPGLFIVYEWGDGPGWFYEEVDLRGH